MPEVTVTERACQELRRVLLAAATQPAQTLRLGVQPGAEFALGLGRVEEGDEVVRSEGTDIFAVDSSLIEKLGEITVDWREAPSGGRIVIFATGRGCPLKRSFFLRS